MELIILKYLSGSKANQQETISLAEQHELLFGRDPSLTVTFSPELDDLVSRKHARIHWDPEKKDKFFLTDLNSHNGVFVNDNKIVNSIEIKHGDIIQLGAGGPKFTFELDPPPAKPLPPTREYQTDLVRPTRESSIEVPSTIRSAAQIESNVASNSIGRSTVQKLIFENKRESRKILLNSTAIIIALLFVSLSVFLYYVKLTQNEASSREELNARQLRRLEEEQVRIVKEKEDQGRNPIMGANEIVDEYSKSVVYIQVSWNLIDTVSGKELYHTYIPKTSKPVYIKLKDGTIEPLLNTERVGKIVGNNNTGSGFVVSQNGFILTNNHVVAPWLAKQSINMPMPGVIVAEDENGSLKLIGEIDSADKGNLYNWVPTKTKQLLMRNVAELISIGKPLKLSDIAAVQQQVEGKLDRLTVTFPKDRTSIKASLSRMSNEHDVALIKIEIGTPLTSVSFRDDDPDNPVKAGHAITILGYPGISLKEIIAVGSKEALNPSSPTLVNIPNPSVTTGNVVKVLEKGSANIPQDPNSMFISEGGDNYELAVTVGPGSSGGPVFDQYGKVIGILNAILADNSGTRFALAVPIKYGRKLLKVGE